MSYLIIPSIELENHKSKFIVKGKPGTEEFYKHLSDMPELLCKLFRLENVKTIHITDKDSFVDAENNNIDNICLMTQATFLPFQALVNFQEVGDCRKILDYGVHRIIISDFTIQYPDYVKDLIDEYSISRIVFYFPVRRGKVYFEQSGKEFELSEYAAFLKSLGAERVVLSLSDNSDFDGLYPREEILASLKNNFKGWTYKYDVSSFEELDKLRHLEQFAMDSLIIAESFYSTNFPCQNIWREAEAILDAPNKEIRAD